MGFGDLLVQLIPMSDFSTTFFPPTSQFLPSRDIPSLAGKVRSSQPSRHPRSTSPTSSLSSLSLTHSTPKQSPDAKVYLFARSEEKANAAMDRLKKETGKEDVYFVRMDLGDLESVKKGAGEFLEKEERLDVLFNNAGLMNTPTGELTKGGLDLQFGTNVVGPYFFTTLLLPILKSSTGRIINTSSSAHKFAPAGSGIELASLIAGPERDALIKKWGGMKAGWTLYGQSKLGNILVSNLWARELEGTGVVSCALHPGAIKTELLRYSPSWQKRVISAGLHPVSMGAYTQLYAGTTAEASAINGKYLNPWARIHKSGPQGDVAETQEILKKWLDEQIAKY
ncbi:hypothetical protein P7C70_g5447, partial [Phenoliferia sp. Uapishka_3]